MSAMFFCNFEMYKTFSSEFALSTTVDSSKTLIFTVTVNFLVRGPVIGRSKRI